MSSVGIRQLANRTSVTTIVILMSLGLMSLKSRKDEKVSPVGWDQRVTGGILDPAFAQVQEWTGDLSCEKVDRARMARGQRASHAFVQGS